MGCYLSKRPHVSANNADELQKVLDQEQTYLQNLINQNNNASLSETLNLNYATRLYMIKSGLIQLEHKIETNKEKINEKQLDWRTICELLDKYYDLKDREFIEQNDEHETYFDESIQKNVSPSKSFLKELEGYLG